MEALGGGPDAVAGGVEDGGAVDVAGAEEGGVDVGCTSPSSRISLWIDWHGGFWLLGVGTLPRHNG